MGSRFPLRCRKDQIVDTRDDVLPSEFNLCYFFRLSTSLTFGDFSVLEYIRGNGFFQKFLSGLLVPSKNTLLGT